MAEEKTDVWAAGDLYEPYVGRWSRLVAKELLNWLNAQEHLAWLDLGCGTGALTETIIQTRTPKLVIGVDRSPEYVRYARARLAGARACFQIGDATSLAIVSGTLDVAVSGLLLNFVPEARRALAEMVRVVRPGAAVSAYVWDYAGKMELMRYFWDAAVALNPQAADLDEGRRFPICQAAPLCELLDQAGLRDIDVRAIDVPTVFRNFDDYWSPFLGGQGPAPGYATSLDEYRRAELRERIRADLPIERDGSIHLVARAWAVRGYKAA
jgi:SAM-dependent methyltransferase